MAGKKNGNIVDYLAVFGDKSFAEMPFNDVDSLALCQLCYLKFDGIVPDVWSNKPSVTLDDIYKHPDYEKLYADERFEKNNRQLFEGMLKGRRFAGLRLNCYINLVEKEYETQFSAVTYLLEGGSLYIAYRGTDETIVGWKEDFNMAYMDPVPGQALSVKYLNMVTSRLKVPIYIGGHSKGGNLAVYAALKCAETVRGRIRKIYSMDGPGVRELGSLEECERKKETGNPPTQESGEAGLISAEKETGSLSDWEKDAGRKTVSEKEAGNPVAPEKKTGNRAAQKENADEDAKAALRLEKDRAAYEQIKGKIVKILPQSSLIGMLFEAGSRHYMTVESNSFGLGQHDPFTWRVQEDHFVTLEDIESVSRFRDDTLNAWISSLDGDKRRLFVDTLYEVISASEAEDLIAFTADWHKSMTGVINALKEVDEDTRNVLQQIIRSLFEIARDRAKAQTPRRRSFFAGDRKRQPKWIPGGKHFIKKKNGQEASEKKSVPEKEAEALPQA